jgi:hypothetical protein
MAPSRKPEGKHEISEGNHGRASLRPAFNEAIAALVEAFGGEAPPADPAMAVWIAFSKLDLVHRTRLAELLMKERGA